jgi:hypothetical protein
MYIGVLSPQRAFLVFGIRLVDRADRLSRRHSGSELRPDVLRRISHSGVSVDGCPRRTRRDRAAVIGGARMRTVRLVRDRDLRVAIEHHAQQRRARTPDTEDEERSVTCGRSRPRARLPVLLDDEHMPPGLGARNVSLRRCPTPLLFPRCHVRARVGCDEHGEPLPWPDARPAVRAMYRMVTTPAGLGFARFPAWSRAP